MTGGAGFIGTSLARRLVEENELVILDNLHRDSLTGTDLAEHPNLRFVQGDVLDLPLVRELTERSTHIVHMAAIAGVDKVLESRVRTMRVNLIGTYNVLEAAAQTSGIERLVDFSTSEVFGTHAYKVEETHVTTQGSVGEARWTYAVSKLAGEYLAHSYFDEFGLPAVSVRPFNVYGPQRRDPPLHRAGARRRGARDPRRRLADPRLVLRGRHRRGVARDSRARRGRG